MRVVLLSICLVLMAMQSAPAAPGYCQIQIVNRSGEDVTVYGTFDDGSPLHPFRMYAGDAPHHIDLHYHGYCHSGMHLKIERIQSPHNVMMYNAWAHVNSTVQLVSH